jgi:hypothetical protein
MRKIIATMLIAFPFFCFSQFGLKAGLNFANVTNASSINNSNHSGFHVGLLFGTSSKKIIGSRTELIFSRQGYNYKTSTNTGNVDLDYIMLPQYISINITKYFSIQLGGQMAYLLNAKADSSNQSSSANPYGKMMNYYNRFDAGYGGGIEIHPASGLLIGARINISVSKLYNFDYTDYSSYSNPPTPSFIPKVDVKNNLFQIFAGWQFGKHSKSSKKKKASEQ